MSDCFGEHLQGQPLRKLKNGEIRRYQHFIFYLTPGDGVFSAFNVPITRPSDWDERGVALIDTLGTGIARHWLEAPNQVRLRSIRPDDAVSRSSLKKWFQTHKIPPWQRVHWPVVEINTKLAVIVGYRTLDEFKAKFDEKALKLVRLN